MLSITLVSGIYGMDSKTTPTTTTTIPQQSQINALCKVIGALPVRLGRTLCTMSRAALRTIHTVTTQTANAINTQIIVPAHQHPYKAAVLAASIATVYLLITKTEYGKSLTASITKKLKLTQKNKQSKKDNLYSYRSS
jgi:hypothetical protein